MKFATVVLLGILFLGSFASMQAADPAGASQVAMAFTGGSAYTSDTGGICITYYSLVGDLALKDLFSGPLFGDPVVDRQHAYFLWVSDFNAVSLPTHGPFTLQIVAAGTATIYYSSRPENRNFSDLTNRSTWGDPVATFVRKAGLFQSTDGGVSGTMTSSAALVSSSTFTMNGKAFNFKDLIPHGMTCFETGIGNAAGDGDYEVGTCLAMTSGQ